MNKFKSSVTGKVRHIKASANRKMTNVVFAIGCTKWEIQDVGETENAFHIQMTGHQMNFKSRHLKKLVAKNFNSISLSLDDVSIFEVKELH